MLKVTHEGPGIQITPMDRPVVNFQRIHDHSPIERQLDNFDELLEYIYKLIWPMLHPN